MEKRINSKIEDHFNNLKSEILKLVDSQCDEHVKTIFKNYFNSCNHLELTKEDFIKRKRIKNIVPFHDRCCAYRANGERCTRRRKDDKQFCGTHIKGQPHGVVSDSDKNSEVTFKKITVRQQDIKGIIYYIDDNQNVYEPNDIMNGIKNPRIIAKYELINDEYSIPSFGI
jgi:hypothetical protein